MVERLLYQSIIGNWHEIWLVKLPVLEFALVIISIKQILDTKWNEYGGNAANSFVIMINGRHSGYVFQVLWLNFDRDYAKTAHDRNCD